jgi:acetyl-CoA carboxylase carboxyl transferase subunit alpha
VISPESCAASIYRDAGKAPRAAEALKLTAPDLLGLKLIDGIIAEPEGGAQNDYDASAEALRHQLRETMLELNGLSPEKCIEERYRKFREMGNFFEGGAA